MSERTEQSLFISVYRAVTERHTGSFVPYEAALNISEVTGADVSDVRSLLQHPPAQESVYPDAARFLAQFAEADGQHVSVWTQGEMRTAQGGPGYQVKKIGQAGIAGMLGPAWRARNRPVGLPRFLGHIHDKSTVLPSIVPSLVDGDFEKVVVVDDRPHNHVNARRTLQAQGWDHIDHYLMARSGDDGNGGSNNGYSNGNGNGNGNGNDHEDLPIRAVESFDEVPIESYAGSKVLWLLDLDYTLIDHKKVVALYSRMVDEISVTA